MHPMRLFLEKHVVFTDQQWEDCLRFIEPRNYKKGSYFIQEGHICREMGYIDIGIMRSFYLDEGNDVTRFMLSETSFMTALASFTSGEPTGENIQAIEDCQLYIIKKDDLEYLYETYPKWLKLGRIINEEYHLKLEKRLIGFLKLNAEERYIQLMKEQPEYLQRVPLQHIASYLGVTPVSLSRIRSQVFRKHKI